MLHARPGLQSSSAEQGSPTPPFDPAPPAPPVAPEPEAVDGGPTPGSYEPWSPEHPEPPTAHASAATPRSSQAPRSELSIRMVPPQAVSRADRDPRRGRAL